MVLSLCLLTRPFPSLAGPSRRLPHAPPRHRPHVAGPMSPAPRRRPHVADPTLPAPRCRSGGYGKTREYAVDPRAVLCAGAGSPGGEAAAQARGRAVLRRSGGGGVRRAGRVVRRRARVAPPGARTHQGRAGVRVVRHRDERPGSTSATPRSKTSSTSSPSDTASRRWSSTSTVRPDESSFRSRSWPTGSPMARSTNCASTSAAGRSPAATSIVHRCSSPIRSCANRTSWASTSVRSRPATSTRSWRHSSRRLRPRARGRAAHPHGSDGLRAFYEWLFSNDGGIPLEHCAAHRRRTRVRAGVQRRALGQDRAAAAGRGRRLRSGPQRQARRGPHLRRRRAAAPAAPAASRRSGRRPLRPRRSRPAPGDQPPRDAPGVFGSGLRV